MIQTGASVESYVGSAPVQAGTSVRMLGGKIGERGWHGTGGHTGLSVWILLPKTGFNSWWVLSQ